MKKLRKIDFNRFRFYTLKNSLEKGIKFSRWGTGTGVAFAWRRS